MTVYAITDTKKGRTGIAPTYLQTTPLPKTLLGPKLVGSELGQYPQKFGSPTSAAIEAKNFKLGTRLVFGEKL